MPIKNVREPLSEQGHKGERPDAEINPNPRPVKGSRDPRGTHQITPGSARINAQKK